MKKLDINVHHITRVEGHGNIVVNYEKGVVESFKLEIVESPRFFEVMLKGRHFSEAPQITARICGICAVGHTLSSLRACESAIGISPSEQTVILRKLILHAEIIQSHVLHTYFLALPDFLNVGSVIPLAETHGEEVKRALRLKKLGNDMCEVLVGRKIHPLAMQINGFSRTPTESDLITIQNMLRDRESDIEKMIELFSGIAMPELALENGEYLGLSGEDYALYDGKITSSLGNSVETLDYLKLIQEHVEEHSSAKHVKAISDSYMVGALARLNLSSDKLHPKAKEALKAFGIAFPNHNPFNINVAQVVETVHCFYDSLELISMLLDKGLNVEDYRDYKVSSGTGVGAVEVPRGILFHEYTIDDDGYIVQANCIIPTGQNLANIESNLRDFVPRIIDRSKEEITHSLEMLVRAYDPCISCSAHFLSVDFV
ncbi:MAG: Ni/Fe hydrogenase subunit alpha [Spirochaetota bacterium]|nr:Ni/Fe hydrogenase subunit alpha [Spirochaetota bacterium]